MGFWAEIKKEWPVIFTAPRVALTYAAGALVLIWGITHWEYHGILDAKDEQIHSKDEQIKTKDGASALKDEQIKFVERQRDEYKEKLGGATPSEAKAQIEVLEQKLQSLEPRVTHLEPRRLSPDQKQAIVTSAHLTLGVHYSLSIAHDANCGDCDGYAAAISFAFHEAGGWEIQQPMVLGPSMKSPKGVSLLIPGSAKEEGDAVARALMAAKIAFDTFPIPDKPLPPNGMQIMPPVQLVITPVIQ